MAELGDTADHRRKLYELNKTCSADIPDRGEFYTYDEYLAERIDVPAFRPDGAIVAIRGSAWGRDVDDLVAPGQGICVQRDDRRGRALPGQGLSLALKLLAIGFVRSSGYRWLATFHHPDNAAAISMNRRLGFVGSTFPRKRGSGQPPGR